jgi:uncharacterized protein YggE
VEPKPDQPRFIVTVRDLTKLGDLLNTVVSVGANNINGISFDVSDKTAALAEARAKAMANADALAKELATLGDLEADGLIRRNSGGLEVTNVGRLFIRNIAMRFDNQLAPPGERRHSRTI